MSIESIHQKSFKLHSGLVLPEINIVFKTYGKLNNQKSNVIWVCHALTADVHVDKWWPEMFGDGKTLDPEHYFIVCPNFLGSCYGSTGPNSAEVPTHLKGKNFPLITIADMVNAHRLVAKHLNIDHIHLLIGASLGGQQALHWSVNFPEEIRHLSVIASNAIHSPWGKAFNASQRLAMEADESFQQNLPEGGKAGLKAARSIALLSYRTSSIYNKTQAEKCADKVENFKAESYQKYQGEKLVKRFCPYAYYGITKSMDSHHIGRGFGSANQALLRVKAKTLCIGIRSDILFTRDEQVFLAKSIENAEYLEVDSIYGHDGFLVEGKTLNKAIKLWLTAKKLSKIK